MKKVWIWFTAACVSATVVVSGEVIIPTETRYVARYILSSLYTDPVSGLITANVRNAKVSPNFITATQEGQSLPQIEFKGIEEKIGMVMRFVTITMSPVTLEPSGWRTYKGKPFVKLSVREYPIGVAQKIPPEINISATAEVELTLADHQPPAGAGGSSQNGQLRLLVTEIQNRATRELMVLVQPSVVPVGANNPPAPVPSPSPTPQTNPMVK